MPRKFTFICLNFLSLVIQLTIKAQNTTTNPFPADAVKIDPVTRRPDKPIPFDKPFPLVVAVDDIEDVTTVLAYKVEYRKWEKSDALFNILKKGNKIRDIKLTHGVADSIAGIGIRKDIKQKLLIIDMPALPPNCHFDFVIIKKPVGDILKEIRKYTDVIADSLVWKHRLNQLKIEYDFFYFSNSIDKKMYPVQAKRFLIDTVFEQTNCCDINNAGCLRHLSLLYCVYYASKLDSAYASLASYNFTTLLPSQARVIQINKSFVAEKMDIPEMAFLYNIVTNQNPIQYLDGRLGRLNVYGTTLDYFDLNQHISNLDSTIATLSKIPPSLQELILKRPGESSLIIPFTNSVDTLITKLAENRKKLFKINSFINNQISSNEKLQYSEWYVSTTEVRDLATKSGYIFTPQIGLSLLVTRSNENKIEYIPKINWGVNINFRAIDKLVNRKYIASPTLWHYLSLHVGLTIGSFREKEYDNLYSTTSLLIGPAFRITRTLYFSAGLSLYRQRDNNPLITKFNVAQGGYACVLLDLDITNAIATIRNTLFK